MATKRSRGPSGEEDETSSGEESQSGCEAGMCESEIAYAIMQVINKEIPIINNKTNMNLFHNTQRLDLHHDITIYDVVNSIMLQLEYFGLYIRGIMPN